MCLIAVKKAGAELPRDEHLLESAIKNRDGIGVAYLKLGSNEVNIKKDFENTIQLITWLKENITKEDLCIIHFRMATHGLKDEGNRHPFPITKNKELLRQTNLVCQMAVAHNGVLNQYTEHKKYSDTQKFILDILAEEDIKTHLDNEKIRKLINSFLGGDRLAILRNDGTIFIFGDWITDGEILYSNSGYIPPSYLYKSKFGKFSNSLGDNTKGYISNCECCGEEKFCNWMTDLTDNIQEWLLCKSCRKRYRKGKVKVEEFIVNIVDREEDEEEIIISGNEDEKKHSIYCGCKSCKETKKEVKVEKECNNCNMMFSEDELFPYYTYRLCRKCINELDYYEASLKIRQDKK